MSLLKTLAVDTKSAWLDYPGITGFEIEVGALSRDSVIEMRKNCTITKMDRTTRKPVETLDEEKFVHLFTRAAIKDWKGLKLKHLEQLMLVNLDGQDVEQFVPYSPEDAETLVSSSTEFDTWINQETFNLDNFRSGRNNGTVEKTGAVAE
jgi:hypothetical protein